MQYVDRVHWTFSFFYCSGGIINQMEVVGSLAVHTMTEIGQEKGEMGEKCATHTDSKTLAWPQL